MARLVQQRFLTSIPSSEAFARKTKALLLGSAVSLSIMVVFVPAVYGEITESSATRPPTRIPDPVSDVKLEVAGRWSFFGFPFAVTAGMIDGDPYAPPKDTDGRREGSGRGWVRELQGRWPGVLG